MHRCGHVHVKRHTRTHETSQEWIHSQKWKDKKACLSNLISTFVLFSAYTASKLQHKTNSCHFLQAIQCFNYPGSSPQPSGKPRNRRKQASTSTAKTTLKGIPFERGHRQNAEQADATNESGHKYLLSNKNMGTRRHNSVQHIVHHFLHQSGG